MAKKLILLVALIPIFLVIAGPWLFAFFDPLAVYFINVLASLVFLLVALRLTKMIKNRESEKEIVYLAAHQLSAPLSSAKWVFEMMLNGDFGQISEEQKRQLVRLNQKNDYLIRLVNELLDTAKLSNGKLVLNPTSCNIKNITLSVFQLLKDKIERKKIEFEFSSFPEDFPEIMADELKIKLAIQNLFDNAIKYTHPGGKIKAVVKSHNKHIEFQIQDSGIGIEKKLKQKVFNKFFRGNNAIKQDPEGHGLGLFFVKIIISSHGGKTWFKSKKNQGSQFYFTLPIKKSYNK